MAGMFLTVLFSATAAFASTNSWLVKVSPEGRTRAHTMLNRSGLKSTPVFGNWVKVIGPLNQVSFVQSEGVIEYIQPNYPIHLYENYQVTDPLQKAIIQKKLNAQASNGDEDAARVFQDNPDFLALPAQSVGEDPLINKQWGMLDIGALDAWKIHRGSPAFQVAVIDTGVDYTHPDLNPVMARNMGEMGLDSQGRDKATNGIDDDGNGYIDDVMGWDFVDNDNKPYDLAGNLVEIILQGKNPGHGTHCAGNVGAAGQNGMGISGVAPNIRIMPMRFIGKDGQGGTDGAIKSIMYAVDNGAKVLSNSWGSEGEDPEAGEENKALRDAISYAENKGALFIAAAGNGHEGVGYDNDSDPKPAYPASYDHASIISVAAIDVNNQLGSFSNWGARTVDLGAPGVKVFSTTVDGKYSDAILADFGINWDGTSMATPHVAGAAALYWSQHPTLTAAQVKADLLGATEAIPALSGKVTSNGKLSLKKLIR